MAGEAEPEDDVLEVGDEYPDEELQGLSDMADEGEQPEAADEEETFIGFGEDDPGEPDEAGLVPHLRSRLKEKETELRELRAKVPPPKPIEVGPKPTLESCEYDEDKFSEALLDWKDRDSAAKAAETQAQQPAQAVQEEFRGALDRFSAQKAAIKVKDFTDAEAEVSTTLSKEQLAALVMTANNSAAVIYALGKHPDRLAKLKAISNPLKLAYAVAEIEKDLKVTTRKRAPEPEGTQRSSAPLSAGKGDKHLARLEAEADRTNDRSKVIAYKRELKRKAG